MLTDLREINRLLLAINEIAFKDGAAEKNDVINECKKVVLGGKIPKHEETIMFCLECNIIQEESGLLKFTVFGRNLFRLNDERNYELGSEQKEYLTQKCFLKGSFKDKTREVLTQFSKDNRRLTFVYSLNNDIPLYGDLQYVELMKQSELILKENDILFVNPNYAEDVSYLLKFISTMTEEDLEQLLKIQKKVGKIAETNVLEFEKNRLKNDEKALPESDLIQIISSTNVDKGYDIESFDSTTNDLMFNRFIEVKGSTGKQFNFHWSSNEVKKAKELGEKYWIYFIPEINIHSNASQKPIMIQNPAEKIFNDGSFKTEIEKYHITKID